MATVYDQTKDPFFQGGEATPNRSSIAVTPSDTIDFTSYPKNVVVTVAGTVSALPLKNIDGTYTNFGSVLAGYVLPIRVRRINATSTTASLVALYD